MKKLYLTIVILITSFIITNGINAGWVHKLSGYNVSTIATANNGDLYAGGRDPLTVSRIWKSTDEGGTWELIRVGSPDPIFGFAFDHLGNVYVAHHSVGLLKSTNHGQGFSVISKLNHFNNYSVNGVECGSNGNVFVITNGGFFRSTNYGVSFTGTALHGLLCKSLLVDREFPDMVFVGVSDALGSDNGLYRSTDGGLTFSNNLLPDESVYQLFQSENNDIFKFTINTPHVFVKSTDRGLSWISMGNLPEFALGMTEYTYWNSPLIYYISTTEGVYRSTDGGFTFELNSSFTNSTGLLNIKQPNVHITFAGVISNQHRGIWMYYNAIIMNSTNESSMVHDFHLYQNYPNPFNPSTTFTFSLPRSGRVQLIIYNAPGQLVSTPVSEHKQPGTYSVTFDASDLPSGVYYYKLDIDHSGETGNYSQSRKMILLK